MNLDRIAEPSHPDGPKPPTGGDAHIWRIALPARDGRSAARRALREILGGYLDLAPESVALGQTGDGKPKLIEPAPLSFNLSHTAGLALVAVTAAAVPVGIDIERLKPRRDPVRLAARWLPDADARAVAEATADRREEAFFAAWTRHEARTKCTGTGVDGPPPPTALGAWQLEIDDGYAAAVALDLTAVGVAEPRITLLSWDVARR